MTENDARVALSDAWSRGRHIFVDAAGSAPGSERTDAEALAAIAELLADDGEQPSRTSNPTRTNGA